MEVPWRHHRKPGDGGGERDRMAQWSYEETMELLASRAELDRSFVETKRNKHLWAAVSSRMEERGFRRTPDQCKCKWKNLVTRYKGSEATEGDADRQFPFYDDMKRIFSARVENLMAENWAEARRGDEQEIRKKRKDSGGAAAGSSDGGSSSKQVEIALMELMRWQTQAEAMRVRASEEREAERRDKEMECRMAMESLAVEKAVVDQGWRQREEERRAHVHTDGPFGPSGECPMGRRITDEREMATSSTRSRSLKRATREEETGTNRHSPRVKQSGPHYPIEQDPATPGWKPVAQWKLRASGLILASLFFNGGGNILMETRRPSPGPYI